MRRTALLLVCLTISGCDVPSVDPETNQNPPVSSTLSGGANETASMAQADNSAQTNVGVASTGSKPSLVEARRGFVTRIIRADESAEPAVTPIWNDLELIKYRSPVGELVAYLSRDPGDSEKHPAIVWITGGDTNSIGDVWSPSDRKNDQSARAFREAGIIMMYPSQRGGNDNPGQREGFYGEVDDILAATDHLAALPYVDSERIYLGGHSTGGTLAMLVGEYTDRYRAVFSLGPAASPSQYGGEFMYCDSNDKQEVSLRSPINWLHSVKSPMFVLEGGVQGSWDGAVKVMANENTNSKIQFFKVDGHDHFSLIAPLTELLARQIISGKLEVSEETLRGLR